MKDKEVNFQSKQQFRVVISPEANEGLEKLVAEVSIGGETSITKSDLANYIFTRLYDFVGESEKAEIRSLHFDAAKALEGILKKASHGNDLPENVREALLKHCGIKQSAKERKAKPTPQLNVDNPSDTLK